MSSAASPDNAPPDHSHAESGPAAGYFSEVLVYAGILHATAELLELLHDFVSDADPVVRIHLGRFLIAYRTEEGTGDPGLEAAILITELNEAADLLHALGGDAGEQAPA